MLENVIREIANINVPELVAIVECLLGSCLVAALTVEHMCYYLRCCF
jgi:hypothetical protein